MTTPPTQSRRQPGLTRRLPISAIKDRLNEGFGGKSKAVGQM